MWDQLPDVYSPDVRGSELNKQWLAANGWTAAEYNKTEPWERTNLRVEATGGLQKTGILYELPGAIKSTVTEQAKAVKNAATATVRGVRNTIMLVVVVVVAIALVVYRKPIMSVLPKKRKA